MTTTFTIIHTALLLLLLCFTCSVSQTAVAVCDHIHHNRRLLHQPFFPVTTSIPPVEPPALPPEPEPHSQQPKYPFSSSSTPNSNPQTPFFPTLPSPPPPPPHFTTTIPTFPANISSLLFPHSSSSSSSSSSRRDIIVISVSITLSLLLIATLASLSAFFLHSRRLHHRTTTTPDKAPGSESLRLFPPNSVPSDGSPPSKPPPQRGGVSSTSSEFLYLGTLVNSRASVEAHERAIKNLTTNTAGGGGGGGGGGLSSSSPYRRLGSPELNPLPPLPKFNSYTPMYRSGEAFLNNSCNKKENVDDRYLDDDDVDDDDDAGDEEFFSPRGSSGRKESSPVVHMASSSRRDFRGLQGEPFGSTSFNSRTASYPHPDSSSPVNNNSVSTSPSVVLSNVSARSSESDEHLHTIAGLRAAVRPLKQSSPSVLSCSTGADSGDTKNSPVRNSGFVEHHRFVAPTVRFDSLASDQAMPTKLPPPPPPLPPQGLWDVAVGERTAPEACLGPPVLVAPSWSVLLPNAIHGAVNNGSVVERNEETPRPKLKPLHWDKVRASSDRVMVWDQIKSSSFQLNEEMIETLFMANNSNFDGKDGNGRRLSLPSMNQENRVLDPKKSQNIAILLRALNVTNEEVCEALVEGNSDSLGTELLASLLKMAPTKDEEQKLKEFTDESPFKLGPAEKFLKAVLDIPFAFQRVDAMLYIANFDSEVEYLSISFETLKAACEELRNSRMFLKLLEAVLKTGNRMNVGTNRGDAHAFKLDTLLKLVDVKGADGKTTLLHFVVQEIIRSEGYRVSNSKHDQTEKTQQSALQDDVEFRKLGLQVVSGLSGELTCVKKAAALDSDVLSGEVAKLAAGITKIQDVLKLTEETALKESGRKFSDSMKGFLRKAEEEIVRIQTEEKVALSLVKEITEYFHGNSAREEAHKFRIFTVVRDFLSILDQVCKEVGKINERTIYSSVHPLPANPTAVPVFPGLNGRQHYSSDDETASPSR